METYHINLGKSKFKDDILWSGTTMRIRKPPAGQKTSISTSESIARNEKAVAIGDIIREAAKLDFVEDEIIFIPTFERVNSLDELKQKLREIAD